jgi:hypothetical protein
VFGCWEQEVASILGGTTVFSLCALVASKTPRSCLAIEPSTWFSKHFGIVPTGKNCVRLMLIDIDGFPPSVVARRFFVIDSREDIKFLHLLLACFESAVSAATAATLSNIALANKLSRETESLNVLATLSCLQLLD